MSSGYVPYNGPIVTRKQAIANGDTRYFTGKPCKHGHFAEKMTGNSGCRECHRIVSLLYCVKNRDKRKEYYNANKQKIDTYQREYHQKNKQKIAIQAKEWRRSNPWRYCESGARRRAAKIKATPWWCDLEEIKKIYASCPSRQCVDHIVPLQGEIVCGLHIPCNLRHLDRLENEIKNRFMPPDDMLIDYTAPGWKTRPAYAARRVMCP